MSIYTETKNSNTIEFDNNELVRFSNKRSPKLHRKLNKKKIAFSNDEIYIFTPYDIDEDDDGGEKRIFNVNKETGINKKYIEVDFESKVDTRKDYI